MAMRFLPRSRRGTWLLAAAQMVLLFASCSPRHEKRSASKLLVGLWKCAPGPWFEFRQLGDWLEFKDDGTFIWKGDDVLDDGARKTRSTIGRYRLSDGDKSLDLSARDSDGQMQQLRLTIEYFETNYFCLDFPATARHYKLTRAK